jgi:hypothetical protein
MVNGEMSLRRLKLPIYEVVMPREEVEDLKTVLHQHQKLIIPYWSKKILQNF